MSPSSSDDDKCPTQLGRPQLPVMSRTSTRASFASYSSTAPFNLNHDQEKPCPSSSPPLLHRLFPAWRRRAQRNDHEAQHSDHLRHNGTVADKRRLRLWHGWRAILFDSWFNILIFLIPVAGVLKLSTPESETLIFSACLLAMIPLVKLHDLATRVLSRRIGGTKTGLLNSSLSNVVELVVAIAALRKCELRVVQSSLIGAMLSKLLLILGMCFFAGGLKFVEQGFDSTATQIHSSLLSISVGAVLLPAAFHFALTYSKDDADDLSLQQQKDDILRMSHGVAIVLLFIYVSYLVFQLWSHTHLYQDNAQPSNKLAVTESVRNATLRMREKVAIPERLSLEKLRSMSGSRQTTRSLANGTSLYNRSQSRISTLEEEPETSIDLGDARGTSPYLHPTRTGSGGAKSALLLSPYASTSQVTLPNAAAQPGPGDTTIRLVPDQQRFTSGAGRSGSGPESESGARSPERYTPGASSGSGSGSDSDSERRSDARQTRGRSRTLSAVLSAYYHGGASREQSEERGRAGTSTSVDLSESPRPMRWDERRRSPYASPRLDSTQTLVPELEGERAPLPESAVVGEEEEEMSWTLMILLMTSVAVLVAVNAEWMVDTMDNVSPSISKEWIALILLPSVSAIAECVTAINVSVKDQLSLSISVAVGSTIQTALFVIPSMVLLGWVLDKPLALLFDPFESVVLYISVHTMGYVVADGKSNWLEGVILVCLYIVIAVSFWFYPGSNFSSNLAVCTMSPPIGLTTINL